MTAAAVAPNRFRLSSARQTAAEVSDGLSGGPASQERLFRTADAGTDQLCCIENGSAADGEDSLSLNLLIKTETLFHALNLRIRGDFGENGDGNVFFFTAIQQRRQCSAADKAGGESPGESGRSGVSGITRGAAERHPVLQGVSVSYALSDEERGSTPTAGCGTRKWNASIKYLHKKS